MRIETKKKHISFYFMTPGKQTSVRRPRPVQKLAWTHMYSSYGLRPQLILFFVITNIRIVQGPNRCFKSFDFLCAVHETFL